MFKITYQGSPKPTLYNFIFFQIVKLLDEPISQEKLWPMKSMSWVFIGFCTEKTPFLSKNGVY